MTSSADRPNSRFSDRSFLIAFAVSLLYALPTLPAVLQGPDLPDISRSLGRGYWQDVSVAVLPILSQVVAGLATVLFLAGLRSWSFARLAGVALTVYLVGAAMPMFAPTVYFLLLGRVCFGFAAYSINVAFDIGVRWLARGDADRRNRLVSMAATFSSGTACVGLLATAVVGDSLFLRLAAILGPPAWRWAFLIYVIAGLSSACLTMAVGADLRYTSAVTPMVQPRSEHRPAMLLGLQAALWASCFNVILIEASYLMRDRVPDHSRLATAGLLIAFAGVATVGNLLVPRVVRSIGARATQIVGFILTGLGYLGIAAAPTMASAVVGAAVAGLGSAAPSQISRTALLAVTGGARASGVYQGISAIGVVPAVLAMPALRGMVPNSGWVFAIAGVLAILLSASSVILIPENPRPIDRTETS